MKYAIQRNNNIIAQVEPQGNVSTKIMGEELVNMTFELPTMVKFQIGDSVNVYGANYYLLQAPVVEKVNTCHFKYSLQFGSIIYELSKIQLLFPDADNNLTVYEGNPIGNADLLIGHVLNNANRLQNGWTKGTVIETEAKQVDFSEDNCLSALAKIAEAFEVEYWIDADKSIHIVERKNDSGYSFQYGKNKGLKSITRNPMDGSNIVTRLYALGSEKNIGAKYRNGSKRLKMDVPYLEKNTDIYNVIEHTKKFDEVYPKRIGTVTAVDANNPLIFTDSTMDFDLNERDGNGTTILIQGIPAKVTFQTGQLAGYMLEIKENGYHTVTKTFTLNKNKDEKAIEVPSSLMRPKVGDQYIITDIVMPASYVTNAEAELKVKAQEYLDKNCKERLQYTVISDPFFFRELNVNIALGNTVHFIDTDLGLDANLRILSISKDLQNPYKVAFEIGEDAAIISIVRAYIEKEKQQTAIIKEQKYNAAAARAAYYFGLELSEKTFDSEGYFDVTKIKPASIDTKLISLGGRMQQFSLPDVNFYLENNYTSLRNTSGRIVHLTIGDTPKTWYIASNTILNIGAVYQYVYVKCQRNGTNANILVTPNQITVEQDPDFFHFEAGYISSIQNGFRVCKMTYGFAQINPQEISIGRWTSPLGGDYIAFNESGIEIKGKVTFASDSPALNQVQEKIDAVQVGAVNLIDDSAVLPLAPNDTGMGISVIIDNEGEKFLRATPDNGKRVSLYGAFYTLEYNQEYVRGIYVRHSANTAQEIRLSSHNAASAGDKTTLVPPNTWTFIKSNVATGSGGNSALIMEMFVPNIALDYKKTILVKGNRLGNDWMPSSNDINKEINVAKQNAANAQNAADAAAQDAISAKKILSDIANDNVVTSQEKPALLQRWKTVEAERPKLIAQAGTYNVNTDNYNNYYVALANYLTNTGVFVDMLVSTNVDGRELENNFSNYFDVRNDLNTAITNAAKTYANGLVDNIKIGGRNTYKKNTPIDPLNVDFQREHVDAPNGFYAVGRNNPDVNNVRLWGVIDGNGEWTVSFEMRGTQSVVVGLAVDICDIGLQHFSSTPDNTWKKYSLTVNVTNYSASVFNFVDFSQFEWAYYLIRNIKIEKGNKATDWTPAPEDIDNEILVAKQNAANAQNAANLANQEAIEAKKILSDIANDNVVTSQEKPALLQRWKKIEAERSKCIAEAGTYNINTDNYNNYYVALANYLTNTGVFVDMLVSTNVDGRELENNFSNYFDVRNDLRTSITNAAKSYANGLVNNLQVGSRNLLLESNVQFNQPPGVYRLGGYMTSKLLEVGKTYTLMFKSGNGGRNSVGAWVNGFQHIGVNDTDGGVKTITFTVENTGRDLNIIDFYKTPHDDLDRWSAVYWAVLVEGNKMGLQSWMAAPEDLEKKITEAQNSANTANQKLADIASDNRLNPSEKQDTLRIWTEIVNEVPIIKDEAATYGVSSANYEGHYVNLSNYLTNNGLLADLYSTSDIDGATFRLYFNNYAIAKVDLRRNISAASKNYTNQSAGELRNEARLKLLAAQYANGNCLYRDADFRAGLNGLNVYNNLGNGTVEVFNWAASSVNAPTKSPNIVICRYNGGGASPHLGGFYFGAPTRANAVLVVRLIMRLDVGYQISEHRNATGDGSTFDWVTPVDGTGNWQEYIGILRCGANGTFSSSMFFAIAGANKVIETYIAYASVFDLTDVDKYLENKIKENEQQTAIAKAQADNALATANKTAGITNFLSTTVDGNVIASGTMLVGDVTGGNAGITGVTDQGSNSVRIFAGANYANKNKAPLNILDNGLIKMHHPNGNKGFELGIVNGKLVFNVYDDIGNLIMEMGSQGIIFSNYIPDSWTNLKLAKFDSANYSPYDATSVTNFANTNTRQIMVNNPGGIEDAQHWNINVPKTEASHINYSTYSAGRSYDSNTYVIYEGVYFEGTLQKPQKPNGSIAKLADGWYYNIVFLSVWKKYGDPYQTGAYAYTFQLFRLSAGKVVETKDYTINGQV
ncbi:phage tail protein [Elizabethkingia anophelis]|uniref:phage tail protein n=1 Tax=Elizabethkingia anophelis TaxID=1117645 RepID=UPI003207DACD